MSLGNSASSVKLYFGVFILLALLLHIAYAEDWPTYMHDVARSGISSERMTLPLSEGWVFMTKHPPQPAWSPPHPGLVENVFEPNRLDFDYVFQVVSVGDKLYFGSSADNKIYCLDVREGKVIWSFFTGGPVRLAPTVWRGKIYVGSDDGFVYCLDVQNGELIWKFKAAPNDERILGNGRMISRWPVRTGVLVDDGIAYFGAGVFPFEGVYLYAVRAQDGKLIWRNDSWGFFRGGWGSCSPQGYLLADEERLYVPTGRTLPACFARSDGRLIYHREEAMAPGWMGRYHYLFGGCYALLTDEHLYSGGREVVALDRRTGRTGFAWFPGRRLLVTADRSFMLTGKELVALDRSTYAEASRKRFSLIDRRIRLSNEANRIKEPERKKDLERQLEEVNGELKEIEKFIAEKAIKWKLPCVLSSSMIKAGDAIFVGGKGEVIAVDPETGRKIWSHKVEGDARGLAAASGRLFVSTDEGYIYCFGGGDISPSKRINAQLIESEPYPEDDLTPLYGETAERIVRETGITKGYCLVFGCSEGRLAYELAKRTELRIYGIESDARKAERAREALDRAGLYGVRVTIDQGPLVPLPYPDYFADLIVSDDMLISGHIPGSPEERKRMAREICRVLKPCGGVVYMGQPEKVAALWAGRRLKAEELREWLYAAKITDLPGFNGFQILENAGVWVKIDRSSLPGAGGWTQQYANPGNTACSDDRLVRYPLDILWFGEPGPTRMLSRHAGGIAPLSINGRFFVEGENVIMAYDAYNGTKLWERNIEGAMCPGVASRGGNMACDEESVFVAIGDRCLRLDAETGKISRTYPLPPLPDERARSWGYVSVADKLLFGSTSFRSGWSDGLFAMDKESGELRWIYRGGSIAHNSIAIGNGRIFFADSKVTEDKSAHADIRKMVALDVRSGQVVWQKPVDLTGCGPPVHLMYQDGFLIFCGAFQDGHYWGQFFRGELAGRRITVLSAKDGKLVWFRPCNYFTRPLVVGNTIYADPWAYDLKTGEKVRHPHPITGEPVPFELGRGHHCGPLSACPHCLLMRSLVTAFYDLERDSGVIHFGGHRPGCHINMIAANGLLIEPEASSGCVCSFSLYSTVVFEPSDVDRGWGMFCSTAPTTPVKHLAINLGAPGDRRDRRGTLWLSYPRPSIPLALKLELKITLLPGLGYFMINPQDVRIEETDNPWLFSFGCCGLTRCIVPLLGGGDEPDTYTVRLGFIELMEEIQPGERVFDIKLQGRTVAEHFDILREAGGPNRAIVKEFKGVEVSGDLTLELKPVREITSKDAAKLKREAPILCSIELIRE